MSQRIVALIQARLGSKRFPRKVLAEINGRPIIRWVAQAVCEARMVDEVVVCIPYGDTDILGALKYVPIQSHRSKTPEDDIAGRFIEALGRHSCDAFVRICADSPLIHPHVIDFVIARHKVDGDGQVKPLYTETTSMPPGQQVQIFDAEEFIHRYPKMDAVQCEHPGLGWCKTSVLPGPRMTVDYPEDLPRIEAIMRKLGRPHWEVSWPELLQVAKECDMEAHVA